MAGGNWRERNRIDPGILAGLKACGRPSPSVAYVGAANGDDTSFFKWFKELATAAGAGRIAQIRLAGKRADPEGARSSLSAADIVFVAGGDVAEGMQTLEATGITGCLRDLHRAGKTFLGMSAGSIMLGSRWVRWPDESDTASAEPFPCLGIAPVCCDTHGEGDDWEELHALLRLCEPGTTGYGIPTGCTLVCGDDGRLRAISGPVHRFERTARSVRRISDLNDTAGTEG